jgi:hypothetical protein
MLSLNVRDQVSHPYKTNTSNTLARQNILSDFSVLNIKRMSETFAYMNVLLF